MTGRCQTPGGKTWAWLDDPEPWQTAAVCRLEDANRFTRDTRPGEAELRALSEICGACPVTAQCARFALQNRLCGFFAGVWIADTGREATAARTTLRRLSPMSPADHGTESGARQHRRRGERPCRSCRAGEAREAAKRRIRQKGQR